MIKQKKLLLMFVALATILIFVAPANAQLGGYWEKWEPMCMSPNTPMFLLYDYDDDHSCDTFWPQTGDQDGYIMFTNEDEDGSDEITDVDWYAYFCTRGGRDTIYLEDASWNGHNNAGTKQTYCTPPVFRCEYEGAGTWCGYDPYRGVYFWGSWTTAGSPYYFEYCPDCVPPPPYANIYFTLDGSSDGKACSGGTNGIWWSTEFSKGHPHITRDCD